MRIDRLFELIRKYKGIKKAGHSDLEIQKADFSLILVIESHSLNYPRELCIDWKHRPSCISTFDGSLLAQISSKSQVLIPLPIVGW